MKLYCSLFDVWKMWKSLPRYSWISTGENFRNFGSFPKKPPLGKCSFPIIPSLSIPRDFWPSQIQYLILNRISQASKINSNRIVLKMIWNPHLSLLKMIMIIYSRLCVSKTVSLLSERNKCFAPLHPGPCTASYICALFAWFVTAHCSLWGFTLF